MSDHGSHFEIERDMPATIFWIEVFSRSDRTDAVWCPRCGAVFSRGDEEENDTLFHARIRGHETLYTKSDEPGHVMVEQPVNSFPVHPISDPSRWLHFRTGPRTVQTLRHWGQMFRCSPATIVDVHQRTRRNRPEHILSVSDDASGETYRHVSWWRVGQSHGWRIWEMSDTYALVLLGKRCPDAEAVLATQVHRMPEPEKPVAVERGSD